MKMLSSAFTYYFKCNGGFLATWKIIVVKQLTGDEMSTDRFLWEVFFDCHALIPNKPSQSIWQ